MGLAWLKFAVALLLFVFCNKSTPQKSKKKLLIRLRKKLGLAVFWLVEKSEKDGNFFGTGRLAYCCTKLRFVLKVNGLNLVYGMYLAKPFCGTTIVAAILSRACSIFDEWFRKMKNQLLTRRSKWYILYQSKQYRGSPPYAHFGTWKKLSYMKFMLLGL